MKKEILDRLKKQKTEEERALYLFLTLIGLKDESRTKQLSLFLETLLGKNLKK